MAHTFLTQKSDIEAFLNTHNIKNYVINSDLTVDVKDEVHLGSKDLSFIPIQFGIVESHFFCYSNKLKSLQGAPRKVNGIFDCSFNELTTLEFAPKEASFFVCSDNKLISLIGAPQCIEGDFDCNTNHLISLEGAPREVGGTLNCSSNDLISLKFVPQKVKKLDCSYNDKIQLDDDFFKMQITQSFIHRNPSTDIISDIQPYQIELFKDHYDTNNFLVLKANELNQIIQPFKEKAQLENVIHSKTEKTKKLKV